MRECLKRLDKAKSGPIKISVTDTVTEMWWFHRGITRLVRAHKNGWARITTATDSYKESVAKRGLGGIRGFPGTRDSLRAYELAKEIKTLSGSPKVTMWHAGGEIEEENILSIFDGQNVQPFLSRPGSNMRLPGWSRKVDFATAYAIAKATISARERGWAVLVE